MSTPLTWVEVDTKAIRNNIEQFRRHVSPGFHLMPVVKSNAYGHGLLPVASLLAKSGQCSTLAVVSVSEALTLRRQGIKMPICVLSYGDWFGPEGRKELLDCVRAGVELPLYDSALARLFEEVGERAGTPVRVHLKIDTGTSRVGVAPADIVAFVFSIREKYSRLELIGLWTHLARAEEPDHEFNRFQLSIFQALAKKLQQHGISFQYYHTSASAGLMSRSDDFSNTGRPGLGIYGLWPSRQLQDWMSIHYTDFQLQPALQWKTKLIQVKDVPAGSFIGYDCTYQVKRLTRIGVLPVGYFDGYDRSLSNTGAVLIRGRRAPILGRVCMNLTMVDVTDIPDVSSGDEVVFIGQSGNDMIGSDEVAAWAQTINYEVVCRIHPDIPRIYL